MSAYCAVEDLVSRIQFRKKKSHKKTLYTFFTQGFCHWSIWWRLLSLRSWIFPVHGQLQHQSELKLEIIGSESKKEPQQPRVWNSI